jgi:hypothetical protein
MAVEIELTMANEPVRPIARMARSCEEPFVGARIARERNPSCDKS